MGQKRQENSMSNPLLSEVQKETFVQFHNEVTLLPEGRVVLQLPLPLSRESLEDLSDWFKLAVKRYGHLIQEESKE